MGEEVEHGGHVTETFVDGLAVLWGYTERYHHERNLRDGRECEDTLDVNLSACNHRCIECRDGTYDSDECQCCVLKHVEGEESGYEIHTGHNHGGGVDECRHRGRALHGVGEPDVEREHGRLAHTAGEDEHQGPCEHRGTHECSTLKRGEDALGVLSHGQEVEMTCIERKYEDTEKESEVGETGDDKRFLTSRDGRGKRVEESDEQEWRRAHKLPEDVHLEDVGSDNESEHRETEERQEGIVTLETLLTVHIAERIDMHHKRDGGDDYKHQCRDGVEQKSELDGKRGGKLKPCLIEHRVLQTCGALDKLGRAWEPVGERCVIWQDKHSAHAQSAECTGELMAHLHAQQSQDEEHAERDG